MKALKWLDKYFEKSVTSALLSLMTLILFFQVIMRRVVGYSLTWSEELARYLFIWLVYFGISYGCQSMKHIKLDAFLGLFFPRKLRPYVVVAGDVIFLFFALFVIVTSFQLLGKQIRLGQTSPALHIHMGFVYAAPFVGFILTSVRQVQAIMYHFGQAKNRGGKNG
jgi:TRAP-type C4-dicarboxylate transport system permease small subunit